MSTDPTNRNTIGTDPVFTDKKKGGILPPFFFVSSLAFASQRQTIPYRYKAEIDPIIDMQGVGELAQGDRSRIIDVRIRKIPRPEGIVDSDQTTGPDQFQSALVLMLLLDLVGIDKRKVELSRLTVAKEGIKGIDSWRQL